MLVCGLPVAGMLLAGCEGSGVTRDDLEEDDLREALERFRSNLLQILEEVERAGGREDVNVFALMDSMNSELAAVWPLLIGASRPELRGHVAPDMQQFLNDIDPHYAGTVRQISEQQLRTARERADELVSPSFVSDDARGIWVYLVLAFLLFPAIAGSTAQQWAEGAWARDTSYRALTAWFWLNSPNPHPWSGELISQMTTLFAALALYLYLSMGVTYRAQEPGMMFGLSWAVMLMLMLVLVTARWTGGTSAG